MESLAYIFIYFLRGRLPWQGRPGAQRELSSEWIMKKKVTTTTDELCVGLPIEFAIFLDYARALKHDQRPDYQYLHTMFSQLYHREGHLSDSIFDWSAMQIDKHGTEYILAKPIAKGRK